VFALGNRDEDLQLIQRHAAVPRRSGASDLSIDRSNDFTNVTHLPGIEIIS
jgi:hypothetical protein